MTRFHIKLFIYGFFLTALLVFNISFYMNNFQETTINQEILYKVDDQKHADELAQTYHLKLKQLSPSGLAIYQLTNKSPISELISIGFSFNNASPVLNAVLIDNYDDPYIDKQYALDMMDTYEGWTITQGSSDVRVAIIDTGIDINHIEFDGLISDLSYNSFTIETGINAVIDTHGHGTMVAGIIAAHKNNQAGIAGIASNVELMIIKANDESEGVFQDSAIIEGIYYATDHGADIINLSLGNSTKNIQMEIAVNYAYNQGVIVVAAAGNDGVDNPLYPAAFERSISVSSVDSRQSFADYSNYGETVDISAPGSDIVTTVINNGYGTVSGTSFATPQITGVIALMLSHFENPTIEEIIQRLLKSTKDQGTPGKDIYYGEGLVNTYHALAYDFVGVNFEVNGGSQIKPIYLIRNEQLTMPDKPVLEDFIFEGWYLNEALTMPFNPESYPITKDITLYAKYTSEYHTITFITQANDVETIIVYHGDTFDLPESRLDYHEFYGWTLDPNNKYPYAEFPVYQNITLYANFKPLVYHQINLYIDGLLYDRAQLETGSYYQPSTFNKTGFIFDGWYLDQTYTNLYQPTNAVNDDITLYAKFEPHNYRITLMVDNTIYNDFLHPYGQTVPLPELQKENQLFLGWYYDQTFTRPYQGQPIDNTLTLYARFAESAYLVTYMIDNQPTTEWYVPDDIFMPIQPVKTGYSFLGFYYDEALTIPYEPMILDKNITLYTDFQINRYKIRFFDYDQETILFETALTAGSTVIPPKPSEKPQSLSFTYEFIGWSEPITNIYEDVDIYPLYKRTFIPNSIQLGQGIDTITLGDKWVDGGLSELDDYLYVVVNKDIDINRPGHYTILYDIYNLDQLLTTIKRIVTVIDESPPIKIELNPGISTILVGETYIEAGISFNQGTLEIISNVNTRVAGTYKVLYQVRVGDITYEITRYVHVIEVDEDIKLQLYIEKKEDDTYVA